MRPRPASPERTCRSGLWLYRWRDIANSSMRPNVWRLLVAKPTWLAYCGAVGATIALTIIACSSATSSAPPPTEMAADLDWLDMPLEDVRSGEQFAISEFRGCVVIIDLMAVWCPNCLLQQQQLQIASSEWSDDEVVIISLDVDPTETVPILRRHVEDHNITWLSAIAPQPMIDQLVEDYGPIATTVTATPLIFIATDGEAEIIGRGLKPKRVLLELVEERQ